MKPNQLILLLFLLFFFVRTTASVPPYSIADKPGKQTSAGFRRLPGKGIKLFQKVRSILKNKLSDRGDRIVTPKQRKQARWSLILGIGSIVLLFTPAALLALPAAVMGLILGIKSVDGNANSEGIIGIITSSVTLLLFLLVIAFVILLIGFW